MLRRLDAAFAKAERRLGPDFQIIITPPAAMPVDAMQGYAEPSVDRLVLNLGSQPSERVDPRLRDIERLVKVAS